MDEFSSPSSSPRTHPLSDSEIALYTGYIQAERADGEREKREMRRQIDDLRQKLEISESRRKEATRNAKDMEWYREQIEALRLGFDEVSTHYSAAISQLNLVQNNYNGLYQYQEHLRQNSNRLTAHWYQFLTTIEDIVDTPRQGGAARQLLALKTEIQRRIVCLSKALDILFDLTHSKPRNVCTQLTLWTEEVEQHNAAESKTSLSPTRLQQESQQPSKMLKAKASHFTPSWFAGKKDEGLALVNHSTQAAEPSVFYNVKFPLILYIVTFSVLT